MRRIDVGVLMNFALIFITYFINFYHAGWGFHHLEIVIPMMVTTVGLSALYLLIAREEKITGTKSQAKRRKTRTESGKRTIREIFGGKPKEKKPRKKKIKKAVEKTVKDRAKGPNSKKAKK